MSPGRVRRIATLLLGSIGALACGTRGADAQEPAFAVIVAADSGEHRLARDAVALIYRRRQTFWPNGTRIQPVNLPAADPLRRAFSACVLGQTPEQTGDYWREMYFHGVLPPHVVASEAAVMLFVQSTPGAIGYVSACPGDARFLVVMIVGDAPNCPKRTATCAGLQE